MPEDRTDGSEGPAGTPRDPPIEPGRIRRRLRRRAARIERRETAEALSALESRGSLTDEQRETVRALAATLVGELTAKPAAALRASTRTDRRVAGTDREVTRADPEAADGRETARTVGRLFAVGGE